MSNSTTLLDLIQSSQTQKEITANALFDAASVCMIFARRATTTSALTWGYYGGTLGVSGTPAQIANGTVTLTPNQTNYVEATSSGVVSVNTAGFTSGRITLYTVIVNASTVTSYTDQRFINFVGTSSTTSPFDLTAFYPGIPTSSALVTRVPVARAITFPASLTGSVGTATVAATSTTDFDVRKNGASVGTVRFASASTTATFIAASLIVLAAGDVISIYAPATADATLANIGIVLAGTR